MESAPKVSISVRPPHAPPHALEIRNELTNPLTRPRAIAELNLRLIDKYVSYISAQGSSKNTVRAYSHALRSFAQFLNGRGVGVLGVQHTDLLEYLTTFEARGLSKQTQALHVHAFRSFQKFASLVGLPCSRAFRQLKFPKTPRRIAHSHSVPEIEMLIAAGRTPFERVLVEVAFGTGCRISELQAMRAEEIDWQNRSVRVLGKGNKERIVFFGAPAEKALRVLLHGRTEGFLFRRERRSGPRLSRAKPNKTKSAVWWRSWWHEYDQEKGVRVRRYRWIGDTAKLTRKEAERAVAKLVRDVRPDPMIDRPQGIRNLRRIITKVGARARLTTWPHLLRHSFATALLNHGAPIRELQELLGHASVSTTALYIHASPEDLIRVHCQFHPRGNNQENTHEDNS